MIIVDGFVVKFFSTMLHTCFLIYYDTSILFLIVLCVQVHVTHRACVCDTPSVFVSVPIAMEFVGCSHAPADQVAATPAHKAGSSYRVACACARQ